MNQVQMFRFYPLLIADQMVYQSLSSSLRNIGLQSWTSLHSLIDQSIELFTISITIVTSIKILNLNELLWMKHITLWCDLVKFYVERSLYEVMVGGNCGTETEIISLSNGLPQEEHVSRSLTVKVFNEWFLILNT